MNKKISLNDPSYFEVSIGERVKREQVYDSDGDIPIYSANVFKPLGFLNHSNLDDFDHDYVLWGIDGNFDFNVKRKGDVFGTTDHCGTIKILDGDVLPEYLTYQLELKKYELGFDRTLRASSSNMLRVNVDVPFTDDEKVDVQRQRKIVSKYVAIKNMKEQINMQLSELENAEIELESNDPPGGFTDASVSGIFYLPKTNSKITRKFCKENEGEIPVYGCSKSANSVLGRIRDDLDGVKYYQNCLTWNRNGSVGYFFVRRSKFATNEDHRALIVKPEYSKHLDLNYLRYMLQNTAKKLGYNFSNKLGKEKIAKIIIQIPITNDGKFDIEKQRQTAGKYERVYAIKGSIVENLRAINDVTVSI